MAYQPIENYGVIGDMRTAALVGIDGSVDWLCFPNFNSPSVFAAILDERKGGRFKISPVSENTSYKQFYWPDTNVLVTRFHAKDGVGEVTDFMTVDQAGEANKLHQLIRRVSAVQGDIKFRMQCSPAFNYARDAHETEITKNGCCFRSRELSLGLSTNAKLEKTDMGVVSDFTLHRGESISFVLQIIDKDSDCLAPMPEKLVEELFRKTVYYWRNWVSHCTYEGRWREMVYRSALVLKLLTFEPTGAVIAAPTCGLPTEIGGERNFDYRYTWLRDAAFTLYAFMRIGFTDEAMAFMGWLEQRFTDLSDEENLQIMYGIDGQKDLTEEVLDHLEGHRKSSPITIGNRAFDQFQLDIYGDLMDSIYLFNKYGTPVSSGLWQQVRHLLNWVCKNWTRKDRGIWEFRREPQHFVFSKLMCWVALDRGIRLASKRSFPADYDHWMKARDAIYEEIMTKGWNKKRQAFVQYYGSDALDASNLMMPMVFFVSAADPKMLKTIDATRMAPEDGGLVSDSLVNRYDLSKEDDGLKGKEGTFNICTFWLVEALTRAGRYDHRRLDEAQLLFEKMLAYSNHVGLYSEQIGSSGEALGNFPQGYTHLSLISAAYNLDRVLREV